MKKIVVKLLIGLGILFSQYSFAQNSVSKLFFGQNAWMPDYIGSVFYNGQLNKNWGNITGSGAGTIRYGGTAVDQNMPTNQQYINIVDSVRAHGMEPMLQV